jgi:hypothetical protein
VGALGQPAQRRLVDDRRQLRGASQQRELSVDGLHDLLALADRRAGDGVRHGIVSVVDPVAVAVRSARIRPHPNLYEIGKAVGIGVPRDRGEIHADGVARVEPR